MNRGLGKPEWRELVRRGGLKKLYKYPANQRLTEKVIKGSESESLDFDILRHHLYTTLVTDYPCLVLCDFGRLQSDYHSTETAQVAYVPEPVGGIGLALGFAKDIARNGQGNTRKVLR